MGTRLRHHNPLTTKSVHVSVCVLSECRLGGSSTFMDLPYLLKFPSLHVPNDVLCVPPLVVVNRESGSHWSFDQDASVQTTGKYPKVRKHYRTPFR